MLKGQNISIRGSIVVFFLSILLAWKLIRIYIPELYYLWDFHVYIMIFMAIYSLRYYPVSNLNVIDILFIMMLVLLLVEFFFSISQNKIFFVSFILPVFCYYYGRHSGITLCDYFNHDRIILYITFVIISMTLVDYIIQNTSGLLSVVNNTEAITKVGEHTGRIFNRSWDRTEIPYFNVMVMRPQGVAFSQHASACLLAAIGFYHLAMYGKYKSLTTSYFWAAFFSIGLAVAFFVGTTFVVVIVLCYIMINKKIIRFVLMPLSIFLIGCVWYLRELNSPLSYILVMLDNLLLADSLDIFKYLLIGEGNPDGNIAGGEIYLLNLIVIVGIPLFVIYCFIFYMFIKYSSYLMERKNGILPVMLFVIAVVIGSIHYSTTFKYPTSNIMFYFIGLVSGKYVLFRKKNYVFPNTHA